MDNNIKLKNLDKNYVVQKSRALMLAEDVNYTTSQLKLIDTYLSCINSRDPDNDTIVFTMREYENLLGVKRIKTQEIESSLRALSTLAITIYGYKGYDFIILPLFSRISTRVDSVSGERVIYLKCNNEAKPFFFEIENKGYVSYRLGNITSMKSKHSIHLYQYLKANIYRNKWEVSLDYLKETALHLNADMYKDNFKDFRANILDKAVNEINRNTDIYVEYDSLTMGGRVVSIEFTVSNLEQFKIDCLSSDSNN